MSKEQKRAVPWLRRVLAFTALAAVAIFISAGGASAATPTALINLDTVSGGAGSQEATIATAQGYAVTNVTGATWSSMSAADFGLYDLLIIGDPTCGSLAASVTASAPVWAPVVMGTAGGRTLAGNRILIGTDPVYHDGGSGTARAAIIRTGIAFAGKQPGRTGVYFDASCGGGAAPLAALTLLSTGSGAWTGAGAPCGGSVSLIASNPSFATLTTASLQGWGCSVHETWPTFPTDWSALAVATDTSTKPTCGIDPGTGLSACGQAYVLIAGSSIVVVSGSISVTPLTDSNPVDTDHTVTAHVTAGGSPLVGQVVTFTVTGQNAGAIGTCVPVGCITNASGDVSFTYHDTNGAGSDTIKASFRDAAGSLQAATAAKDWVAPLDADLRVVSKVDSADPVLLGSTFSYIITVGNAGPANATGVTVTDTLPAGLSFVSGAGCSAVGPVVTCTVGAIAVGSTAAISFIVNADAIGTWTDTASVSGTQPDLNAANNSASASTTVQAVADLRVVSKTDSADPVLHGDSFQYTIAVMNAGPSNATGVVVSDTLPAGLSFVSGAGCSAAGSLVTCPVGALASGSTASVTFTVKATSAGVKVDTASVAGDQSDPDMSNNTKTESTTVKAVVALSVFKKGTASMFWGQNATYTVVVSNAGPDAATGVEVTDSIAGPGTFVSGTAAAGACTIAAGLVHCPVGTIAAGDSSLVTIVVHGDEPGIIVDKAHAAGNEIELDLTDNGADASTDVLAHPTRITYTGATTSDYHDAAVLSAKLVDTVTGLPLSSKAVDFALDAQTCTDGTNAAGVASCTIVPNEAAGSYPLSATYAGSFLYVGSIDTGTFIVTLEETTTTYTGVTGYVANGSTVTLSAVLKEDGVTPIAGRTLNLTLGSQSCADVTNGSGFASCTVVVSQPVGPGTVTATFAGDGYYLPSNDGNSVFVYSFAPGGGAFVVGNLSDTGAVTFWGAQWWKVNSLSGGTAPASFKGYAKSPARPSCGTAWSTDPGNSAPPPAGPLPTYMAVLVTSTTTKSGSQINGNTPHIVLVKTNSGYDANPGHAGTGTVIATLC